MAKITFFEDCKRVRESFRGSFKDYERKVNRGTLMKWAGICGASIWFGYLLPRVCSNTHSSSSKLEFYSFTILPLLSNALYFFGSSLKDKGLIDRVEKELKEKYELKKPKNRQS